jgi:hypothetical protein
MDCAATPFDPPKRGWSPPLGIPKVSDMDLLDPKNG